MSTKMIGVVDRGSGWQKDGIELGSYFFNPNRGYTQLLPQYHSVRALTCMRSRPTMNAEPWQ